MVIIYGIQYMVLAILSSYLPICLFIITHQKLHISVLAIIYYISKVNLLL